MYINIYNANKDSLYPKDVREMLHELDTWERDYMASRETQRANSTSGGKGIVGENEVEEHNILLSKMKFKGVVLDYFNLAMLRLYECLGKGHNSSASLFCHLYLSLTSSSIVPANPFLYSVSTLENSPN